MNTFIEFQDISFSYHTVSGETPALHHINFSVNRNDFVAIVGPSGCGKSTLLSMLCGLIRPEYGAIKIDGIPLSEKDLTSIGYMLQKDQLFEWRTIEKNILLGLEIQKKQNPESLAYAQTLLKTYGLSDFRNAKPSELSGGMRQRAALIRTLVLKPELLLLDEPFSALDYQTRLNTANDIGNIIKKEHKTAILVTHDISEAVSLGSQVVVLTRRPATVKRVIPVQFPSGLTPLERRNTPEFKTYFNLIWKELNQNA